MLDPTLRGLITPLLSLSDTEQFLHVRRIREERRTRPPEPLKPKKEPKSSRPRKPNKDLDKMAQAMLEMDPADLAALIAAAKKEKG